MKKHGEISSKHDEIDEISTARVVKSLESVQLPLKSAWIRLILDPLESVRICVCLSSRKMCCFTTVYHKSVLHLPQFTTKVWYFTTKYVPGNLVHFIYVPDVPVIWYKSGTESSPPLDGNNLLKFDKNLHKIYL